MPEEAIVAFEDQAHRSPHAQRREHDPQPVRWNNDAEHMRKWHSLVPLVEEVLKVVDDGAVKLLVELDQADHAENSRRYERLRHAHGEEDRRHERREAVAHVHTEAEAARVGVARIDGCVRRPHRDRPVAQREPFGERRALKEEDWRQLADAKLGCVLLVLLLDLVAVYAQTHLAHAHPRVHAAEEGECHLRYRD
eukprot:CAMPEP_0119359430 /NCGR_PEP_ID=MMETSP1334-20130426/7319_1 /TAXON_ID=127549 /ORGANISM="Calcidiscus leptoporus, Strain RCC1130" /LENGTH=194 /DNA_ID=CAMNT_0007374099 /DNA_START=197 /DNA_END=778 /DNA_ORIENTATION=+